MDAASVHVPSYMDRKDLLRDCHSLLPLNIIAKHGPPSGGGLFPKGWHCVHCGKLNKEVFLRHRKCMSALCQVVVPSCAICGDIDIVKVDCREEARYNN
jgi:hypothetical protein